MPGSSEPQKTEYQEGDPEQKRLAAAMAVVAPPLRRKIETDPAALQPVILELKAGEGLLWEFLKAFRSELANWIARNPRVAGSDEMVLPGVDDSRPRIRARLAGDTIQKLLLQDHEDRQFITAVFPDSEDTSRFNPDNLVRTVISVPMLRQIEKDEDELQSVLIEVNVNHAGGRSRAKQQIQQLVGRVTGVTEGASMTDDGRGYNAWKSNTSEQYVYARLTGRDIRNMVRLDAGPEGGLIYHVWPDFRLRAQMWRSAATVKADACRRSFATTGRNMVWAVFDSGIDGKHPHFAKHNNLQPPNGLTHYDFTRDDKAAEVPRTELQDDYGHGTHVAGVIAGELGDDFQAVSLSRERNEDGRILYKGERVTAPILGVAPECSLLSYKVLDKRGEGEVSTVIAAIQKVQELNGYGRHILIHGVNMSLGYDFDPEWFACGQSPICVEVDRLVRSGVAVVIAAGNTGKGFALTINDPGNAELAITVGATHRDMPHRYGVSYFSSKGPTGDGRAKPDLLAPGERIISCGAGPDLQTFLTSARENAPLPDVSNPAYYLERSGTSMAAPHVSGIIAGILSTRTEFVGLPEDVKVYLTKNATDLGRERNFQGGGLVDMMRTIQAM